MEQKFKKKVEKYRSLFNSITKAIPAHDINGHNYISLITKEAYKSVTYFTSFIKDPSIRQFLQNRSLEYIENNYTNFTKENIKIHIEQAKLAPVTQFTDAGSIGSQTHSIRQEWFDDWIRSGKINLSNIEIDNLPIPNNADPEVISGCRAIKKFLKETGYIPVACELALVDDDLKVGGTIDDLGVIDNKLYFIDLKTSNQGKKPSYAFQVRGFYQRMIKKTFKVTPKKTYILHTSKADGTYQLIDLTDMKFLEKDAQHLVHCSRSWDKVVSAFKPKVRMV